MEQLGLCTTTIEPVLDSLGATNTEAQVPRVHAPQQEESLHITTKEKPAQQ